MECSGRGGGGEAGPDRAFLLKCYSDLNTLRDFWIAELEEGDENNLVSVNSNFYSSTKTFQVQGSQKDHYVKKLRNIVENGTKAQQDTPIESTSNSGSAEITDPVLNLKPTSDQVRGLHQRTRF